MLIRRIFYPIGQGAFYAEKHENFNIVYDCGNWRKTKKSGTLVESSFCAHDVIDILFISHMDWDHISRIVTLKNTVSEIKVVILPLLHEEEKNLLTNLHRIKRYSSLTLINDPESFFGKGTKIIKVKGTPANLNEAINFDPILVETAPDEIESSTPLYISEANYNWCFIPFNVEHKKRQCAIEKALFAQGFDVRELKENARYTIDIINNTDRKNQLKEVYKSIEGNINSNSLILYSGSKSKVDAEISWKIGCNTVLYSNNLSSILGIFTSDVSCIYTGDADLNEVELDKLFSKYWQYVGIIQIPHHGSYDNFDFTLRNIEGIRFPVSYGLTNTYGHPSIDLINKIKNSLGHVYEITEDKSSALEQTIELRPPNK